MSDSEFTLIAELDRRQDSVLQGIDDLNDRILSTLAEWTNKETTPTESPNESDGQLSKSA